MWVFTPALSRYRFVHPCIGETTAGAIEACEAAWDFYAGVFKVLIVDNIKAIVNKADPPGRAECPLVAEVLGLLWWGPV